MKHFPLPKNPHFNKFLFKLLLAGLFWTGGCTTGPMRIGETWYYKVSNGTNANYFRLTVNADTQIGVSEYRSGFFPARSVDSLFGEVSSRSGLDALKTREEIEKLINTNVFKTTKAWLEAAANTNSTDADFERLGKARKRVLEYPGPEVLQECTQMDYNPITGLVQFHSDEKLIFLLASDPNEVIGKIANFTESDETVMSINRLAGTVMQYRTEETAARKAGFEAKKDTDAVIYQALQYSLQVMTNLTTTSARAISEIDVLLPLVEGAER